MADRVVLHRGLTLPGAREYTSYRDDVTFDLELGDDLAARIVTAQGAASAIAAASEVTLAQNAANLMTLSLEGVGLETEFKAFAAAMRKWATAVEKRLSALATPLPSDAQLISDTGGLAAARSRAEPKARG